LHPHRERLTRGVEYDEATIARIEQIRPRLSREFKNLPAEELMISGIFLIGRRPGQGRSD
jgi:hypothetical protein